MRWLESYGKLARLGGLRAPPIIILSVAFLVGIALVLMGALTHQLMLVLTGALAADLLIMAPYFRGEMKVREIEENLPDALKQMASTLRSGGTYEVAIREVVYSDYGELSRQFSAVLKDLESGMDLRRAFERLSGRVPSEALHRMIIIMLDAIHAGGGLADVLEDIAEDVREMNRIRAERRTRTTMQAMFILMLSVMLGPFIFGAASGLMGFMLSLGEKFVQQGTISRADLTTTANAIHAIQGFILFYTLFQAVAAAFVVSIIREGTPSGGLRNAAIFLFLAYVFLMVGQMVVGTLLVQR